MRATLRYSKSKNIGHKLLYGFYRELSKGLAKGIPLIDLLELDLSRQSKSLAIAANQFRSDLQSGSSIASAAGKNPALFSAVSCALVEVGEQSGNLPLIFARLSENERNQMQMNREVVRLLVYPLIIIAIWLIGFPLNEAFYYYSMSTVQTGSFDWNIAIWRYLTGVASNLLIILGVVFTLVLAKKILYAKLDEKRKISLLYNIPWLGAWMQKREWEQLAFSLHLTLSSGLAADQAVMLLENTRSDPNLKAKVQAMVRDLQNGASLHQSMTKYRLFPKQVQHVIKHGETTGDLAGAFADLAEDWRGELQQTAKLATAVGSKIVLLLTAILVLIFVAKQYLSYIRFVLEAT